MGSSKSPVPYPTMQSPSEKRLGVHSYMGQWPIYSLAWSARCDRKARLAIGSFLEDYSNKVELVQFNIETSDFATDSRLIFDHPYAPTNLMFFPSEDTTNPDLIATSGDYLRLWEINDDHIKLKTLFNGNKSSEFSAAITSFDWADFDVNRVATCSVDSTCVVWDVEKETVDTQLVAHDKAVYDISWGGYNVFGSVSGDGSLRIFDLRDKERSTIIYENPIQDCPLLRVEWNKCDPRFVATVGMDSNRVVILDIRYPTTPLMELSRHKGSVNAISWAPSIGRQICSVGDDSRALIWDVVGRGLRSENGYEVEPELWYSTSMSVINQVRWCPLELEWIAVASTNKLQLLKV
ncbi:WD repeat-containing protein LWD1-like [Tripterygium wilfordii]|uniref:WD repeat-containing protein LWD1-like n=1 Tax=Tripterygium wilfordii TaxID=458696 RepID=UPI0018F81087|nr:WD repeat-containing protein LWD1-like [Tripterygium wilfordii]